MTREQLLLELRQDTWVALRPSPIHGIGVFALRDIPAGCRSIFSVGGPEWIPLSITEVEALPAHSRHFIETYCLYDDHVYFVPSQGFKLLDPVLYLNHSSTPNIISINDGELFESINDIPEGTELLIDYGVIAPGSGYS